MERFEATRIEHRVIEAPPAVVSEAVPHADFMDSLRRSRVVSGMFAARAVGEHVVPVLGTRLRRGHRRSRRCASPIWCGAVSESSSRMILRTSSCSE
jgi:hypothetical protein